MTLFDLLGEDWEPGIRLRKAMWADGIWMTPVHLDYTIDRYLLKYGEGYYGTYETTAEGFEIIEEEPVMKDADGIPIEKNNAIYMMSKDEFDRQQYGRRLEEYSAMFTAALLQNEPVNGVDNRAGLLCEIALIYAETLINVQEYKKKCT